VWHIRSKWRAAIYHAMEKEVVSSSTDIIELKPAWLWFHRMVLEHIGSYPWKENGKSVLVIVNFIYVSCGQVPFLSQQMKFCCSFCDKGGVSCEVSQVNLSERWKHTCICQKHCHFLVWIETANIKHCQMDCLWTITWLFFIPTLLCLYPVCFHGDVLSEFCYRNIVHCR
jgi:hypothetical protein